MSVLGKDPDSNMQVANLENLPFYMEDVNIKPVIPLPTSIGDSWEKIRAQLLRRSTSHMQFRAMWDGFSHNDWCKLKSQKELNVMIILIQALGEGKSALLQLAKDRVDWPNKYVIQLSPTDALQLPSFENRLQGVFYGTEGRKSAYVWNLMPVFKAEELHLVGRFLKLKAHLPACGPINPQDNKKSLTVSRPITVTLPFFITSIPTREVPMKLWKSPNNNHLQGMVCGHPVQLKLLSACQTCGSEDHNVAHCLYTDHLLGAPAIPESRTTRLWKSVTFLNQSPRRKKKAYKPASEVSTIKQRGNGCPVASSSLE
ncbi:uncharacterized protein PGTG_18654 [Puccinia graminis f. sp. tritici CRL 75-36-700-3]|uniref:Uncharacterized protein n=1 Tax=Puccinia graminis f. sp. tritici (strain CRL 75-36-700-3 / race SCCL) TaxID=418459 RepID=E3L895_PUCGT|nr:uncharacterized protein PGTG_18654 [Puccinia graminis f. sp. tritici CRL 75-36-700-3]EFP92770.2 hypothetical protein PGTG_18654 [Puccinia graminis f. sp. tritici CRL 75-36-700-3]